MNTYYVPLMLMIYNFSFKILRSDVADYMYIYFSDYDVKESALASDTG